MSKICLIKQPAGIGDIIYCQKISKHYMDLGYSVIWPVLPEYTYISEYIINGVSFPNVYEPFEKKEVYINSSDTKTFTKEKRIITDDFVFLPIESYNGNGLYLEAKYEFSDVPFNKDWLEYVSIKRNFEKENELFDLLNPNHEKYVFVNHHYGTRPTTRRIDFDFDYKGMKIIEMSFVPGFTFFDWFKLIEEASDICFSCSAPTLLVEMVKPVNVPNPTIVLTIPDGKIQVSCLYNLNWNFIMGHGI